MDNQFKPSNAPGFKLPIKIGAKPLIIIGAVVVLVGAGLGFWFWSKSKQAPVSQTQEAPTLGSQIFEKTQNTLEGKVPDANPFKNQKNPLDVIYKNPFE